MSNSTWCNLAASANCLPEGACSTLLLFPPPAAFHFTLSLLFRGVSSSAALLPFLPFVPFAAAACLPFVPFAALPFGLPAREVRLEALAKRCSACWAAEGALGLKSCRCKDVGEGPRGRGLCQSASKGRGGEGERGGRGGLGAGECGLVHSGR